MLQFLRIPIRDWNKKNKVYVTYTYKKGCNFYESLLGIETLQGNCGRVREMLQFLRIPIRDWNMNFNVRIGLLFSCNFYESLLGIETIHTVLALLVFS